MIIVNVKNICFLSMFQLVFKADCTDLFFRDIVYVAYVVFCDVIRFWKLLILEPVQVETL